ncbi:hypothetical protein LOK49_LG08G02158 [Camellia lanceoleosa]|uniref:Uncharacterized protein n=1 Tax=Camellia lanceoleosa TaxID=1840588 RepID=A0ACC0GSP7_9ERIC|nr:hypothetical protein LOK49_LG08G02158 [Camellia lanceoleosa]
MALTHRYSNLGPLLHRGLIHLISAIHSPPTIQPPSPSRPASPSPATTTNTVSHHHHHPQRAHNHLLRYDNDASDGDHHRFALQSEADSGFLPPHE